MKRFAALPFALLALAPTAPLAAPAGSTLLVSRPSATPLLAPGVSNSSYARQSPGQAGDGEGGEGVSGDGASVVFTSDADHLSTADDNRFTNCFIRTGTTTELVNVADGAAGAAGNAHCANPAISDDGTRVAFITRASNLDPSVTDTNAFFDVYVRDLDDETTTLVSRATGGTLALGSNDGPSISENGTKIAFSSSIAGLDKNMADGPNADVFVYDTGTDTTTLVSRSSAAVSDGHSGDPSISADGTLVAFESTAANLHPADTNATLDVHLRGIDTDTNELVSRATGAGTVGDAASGDPAISADGTHVAYDSAATNLVAGDTNGVEDVFVRTDVQAAAASQTTVRASVKDDGSQGGNGHRSRDAAISGDGSLVVYETWVADASIGDPLSEQDIHVRDLGGSTSVASATTGTPGTAANSGSNQTNAPSISADGTRVIFESDFDAASPDDDDRWLQVFARALDTDTTTLVSRPSGTGPQPSDGMDTSLQGFTRTSHRVLSRDGRYVAFLSDAELGHGTALIHAYRHDLVTDTTTLVSRASGGAPANNHTYQVAISADGSKVAFLSDGNNLADGANNTIHVFWRDLGTGTTKLVDRRSGASGTVANSSAQHLTMSADGTRVAWLTGASNLHPDGPAVDTNTFNDIYVRDVVSDMTLYGSATEGGLLANAASSFPALDGDGSTLAFGSAATNLVVGDSNTVEDVFVRDLSTGTVALASRADGEGGNLGDGISRDPSLSEDGTKVAFWTDADNFAGAADTFGTDVYRRDLTNASTTLVSRTDGTGGTDQNSSNASGAAISGDGNRIVFHTGTAISGENDLNGATNDVYVRDVNAAETTLVSVADGGFGASLPEFSERPSISLDGNCVAFVSQAQGLTADYPGSDFQQVYLRVLSGECPDATAPNTQVDDGPTGTIGFDEAEFEFSSPDPDAAFECKLDDAAFAPCTSPHMQSGIDDGAHTFHVRAVDLSGNLDGTPATRAFTVDTTLPDTTIDSAPPAVTNDATPTLAFSANEAGQGFECRVDEGAFATCASPQTLNTLADGTHTFQVRAVDGVGNRDATPAVADFTVDTGAPETTITSGPNGAVTDATPTFAFEAGEAGAAFQCRLDDGAFAACSSPFTATALPDGPHTFSVRATDAAGNQEATAAAREFVIDTAGPVISIELRGRKPRRVARRGLRGTVECSEACTGKLKLRIRGVRPRPAGSAEIDLGAAGQARVRIELKKKAARRLRRRERAQVSVRGAFQDALGNARRASAKRELRR
ncbi:MAG TPA: Ig-like domain-containing protein [Thermoleophilaceae bacterium]|nr:Ig-like domain-containing protein [Thermoleophilaceae bacterium]